MLLLELLLLGCGVTLRLQAWRLQQLLLCLHELLLRLKQLLLQGAVRLLLVAELLRLLLQALLQLGAGRAHFLQFLLLQDPLLLLLAGMCAVLAPMHAGVHLHHLTMLLLLLQRHVQLDLCSTQVALKLLHLLLQVGSILRLVLQLLPGFVRLGRHLFELPLCRLPALRAASQVSLDLLQLAAQLLCPLLCQLPPAVCGSEPDLQLRALGHLCRGSRHG